ncbi:uncharacterized protein [Oscarella lobularis]|uniref:uncharacterized protein isoform X2 n=1 Tax=Oscarella lobularis TaxID=121494 RepID=UPI0033143626
MILSRLNRVMQRLTLPSRRLFAENGQKSTASNGRPSSTSKQFNFKNWAKSKVTEGLDFVKRNAKTVIPLAAGVGYLLYNCANVAIFEYRISGTTNGELSTIAKESYVDRSEEKERLKELIMAPFPPSSYYHLYQGPHRAGKTHAVMEVIDELRKEGVKGVHYVHIDNPLYSSLADGLSMNHRSVIYGVFNAVPQMPGKAFEMDTKDYVRVKHVMLRLAKSAKKYKDGRVTTIILDGVNSLVPKSTSADWVPEELHKLLDLAKDHADKGKIHWILVDSSGVAMDAIKARSSSSRMKLLFSCDVDEQDAKEFLKGQCEAAEKKFDVDELYKCATGGRIGLLKLAADNIKRVPHSTSQKQGVLEAVKRRFGIATHPQRAAAAAITTQEELLKSLLSKPKDDIEEVFPDWQEISDNKPIEVFQYRILRLLAENPMGVEEKTSLRRRAKADDFYVQGVDCTAAISQLLKNDLLRYTSSRQLQLHSHAIKYLVLQNERHPFKSGGDDE